MESFLSEWGTEIILSLIITMLGYFLKRSANDRREQEKRFQQLLQNERNEEIDNQIEVHLEPVYQDLEDIRKRIFEIGDKENQDLKNINKNFDLIIASYKYRLIQLCKQFRRQGFMYEYQYNHLYEFFTLYSQLGGNGAAKEAYDKTIRELPIKANPVVEEQEIK